MPFQGVLVFVMRADPHPNEIVTVFDGQGAVKEVDGGGPESAHFLELQRGMVKRAPVGGICWSNPAVEDQAINRAHRLGVSEPVFVTRMLALGTIEERIDRILEEKRELFATIFPGTERPAKLGLSQQELFGLFNLEFPTASLRGAA